jgi:hypothetical protein
VVARAVAVAIVESGCAPKVSSSDVDARLDAAIWEPDYLPYRAI